MQDTHHKSHAPAYFKAFVISTQHAASKNCFFISIAHPSNYVNTRFSILHTFIAHVSSMGYTKESKHPQRKPIDTHPSKRKRTKRRSGRSGQRSGGLDGLWADVAAVGGVEDRERVLGFVVAEMAQGREEQVGLLKAVFHIVISRYEHHRRVLLFKADVVQRRGVIRDQSAAVEVSFL